jgi:hypothetical protein
VSTAEEALAALARDLVVEIAAGHAIELAAVRPQPPAPKVGSGTGDTAMWTVPPPDPPKGAAAVHPQLGHHLHRLPGDTISHHAFQHMFAHAPPQPIPPTIPGAWPNQTSGDRSATPSSPRSGRSPGTSR